MAVLSRLIVALSVAEVVRVRREQGAYRALNRGRYALRAAAADRCLPCALDVPIELVGVGAARERVLA